MLILLFVVPELLEIRHVSGRVSLRSPACIGPRISKNYPCRKIFLKISFRAWLAFQPISLKIFKKYLVGWYIVYYLCVTKR